MTLLTDFWVSGRAASTQTGSIAMKTIQVRGPFGIKTPKRVPYPTRRNLGWIDEFTLKAKSFRPRAPLVEPFALELTFFRARPVRPKKGSPMVPVGWVDVENLAKGVVDALQGDFYSNDALCSDMILRKRWAGPAGEGVQVRVYQLEASDVA